MSARSSLAVRGAIALVLMIGFYALALGIVAGLAWLAWFDAQDGSIHIKLIIVTVLAGGLILWSILPRPDHFEPPGPRLVEREQPRLFDEIHAVAKATGQAPPAEVYLLNEMNAFVTHRGGVMGIGGRRVMGLGLPLLQALDREQVRAVLAHEFGHFHGGDTALGPWIYKTRGAIGRTVGSLAQAESWLSKPFEWYGTLFLRITQAISRQQEYDADALAARVVGPAPLIEGLKRVRTAAIAYDEYWRSEAAPVLNSGYRPPLAGGFRDFLAGDEVREGTQRLLQEALTSETRDPYDTHPALPDRLAAIERLGLPAAATAPGDDQPAITLLDDLPALELRLLSYVDPEAVDRLRPIDWSQATDLVLVPGWQRRAIELQALVSGTRAAEIPDGTELEELGRAALGPIDQPLPRELFRAVAVDALGACLCAALLQRGWSAHAPVGAAIELVRGDHSLAPFRELGRLAHGEQSRADWRATCERLAIADVDLGEASSRPPAAPAKVDFFGM